MTHILRAALTGVALLLLAAAAPAQSAWGVAVLPSGTIYFSDIDRDQVWRIEPGGKPSVVLTHTHCHSLVSGYDGSVYGEAVGLGRGSDTLGVWQMTPGGRLQYLQAPTPRPSPSIWIVHDRAGNGYAWQRESERVSQILKRTPEGGVSVLAGGAWGNANGRGSAARFAQVGGMAVTASGTLYVTDSGNLRRIQPDGTVESLARNIVGIGPGGLPGDFGLFNHSQGVVVDPQENVYVVDRYRLRVIRWDAARGASVVYNSPGYGRWLASQGLTWFPTGVAVAADGQLYVMETFPLPRFGIDLLGAPRILKLRPDGSAQRIATAANRSLRAAFAVGFLAIVLLLVWWRTRKRALRLPRNAQIRMGMIT